MMFSVIESSWSRKWNIKPLTHCGGGAISVLRDVTKGTTPFSHFRFLNWRSKKRNSSSKNCYFPTALMCREICVQTPFAVETTRTNLWGNSAVCAPGCLLLITRVLPRRTHRNCWALQSRSWLLSFFLKAAAAAATYLTPGSVPALYWTLDWTVSCFGGHSGNDFECCSATFTLSSSTPKHQVST